MVVCNLHTVCGNLTRVVIISHFRAYLMTIFKALLELNAENSLAWSSSCKTSLSKEKKIERLPTSELQSLLYSNLLNCCHLFLQIL